MKRATFLLSLAAALIAADGYAETYQICLYPMPCAGKRWGGKKPPVQKPAAAKEVEAKEPAGKAAAKPEKVPPHGFYLTNDPLSRAVLRDALANDEGIVSARVGQEGENAIVYSGKGSLELPASKLPEAKDKAVGAAQDADWVQVDSKTKAAKQVNSMRDKRKELKGASDAAKTGADKMWGDAAPAGGDAAPARGLKSK